MSPEDKICVAQDLAEQITKLQRPLVMTNGVFDVLHRGHVSYLDRACQLGASLLVAINSDASARMLGKGPDRPLNTERDRAYVLAGLTSVSKVTFFDTRTPLELVKTVRPDIYVKGGDYNMELLEETPVVRSWGGQSIAIPFIDGFSTTALVKRIRQPLRKAAFLDRDGVINRDRAYVHRWEDFEFIPGAIEGMRRLQQNDYALVVVTNQSGIARGYYTGEQYQQLNQAMCAELLRQGVKIDGVYHCPHHPEGIVSKYTVDCDCRKPAPGLIVQAARELGLSLPDSLMIGDKSSDIEAARAAGVGRAYQVISENPESRSDQAVADSRYTDLLSCVTQLLSFNL